MFVFAHRGASGEHPENTLRAVQAAIDMDVDGIEIDVHCVGGELIVIHDKWLHRTTNGRGQLSDFTVAELQRFDAGEGESIPTLWQVMELVDGRVTLNIELKGKESGLYLPTLLKKACREFNFNADNLIVSSFDHHQLKQIKAQLSWLKIGALTASLPLKYAEFASELNAFSVHIDIDFIDRNFVKDAHSRGLQVLVYTVDELADINYLKQLKVDGVFTNFPNRIIT